MAFKENEFELVAESSFSTQKAKPPSTDEVKKPKKEKKILTTFSIEPSFKKELEELFSSMGLGWAAGIRFSLREFIKKHGEA